MELAERIKGAVLGHAIGDALGVPVEFRGRETLRDEPVIGMRGHGTHNQPPGTWSDDTSLMLCLLEGLQPELDLRAVGNRFIRWEADGYLTPHGHAFDIGNTTREAIARLREGIDPEKAGGSGERDNGNGSLMRILPIAFLPGLSDWEAVELAHRVSCLTHKHPRAQMACGLFVLMSRRLLEGASKETAYHKTIEVGLPLYETWVPYLEELDNYSRFLSGGLAGISEDQINSGGYAVHTLESAVWCLLNYDSFSEAVLAAVNLGNDTDTTAAVAGGLAGALYGIGGIPVEWLATLHKRADIEAMVELFLARPA